MVAVFNISDYFAILVFFIISGFISFIFSVLPMFLAKYAPNREKLSSYECGFSSISNFRNVFDVRFYLVAILFIIFDLEIAFLFPWSISLANIGYAGFWSMMIFLGILIVGFIYEWHKGALEWE